MKEPRFHVIDGKPAPDSPLERVRKRTKATPKPAAMAECRRCGGREFIETRTGVLLRAGRPSGGTKTMICVICFANGERVAIP